MKDKLLLIAAGYGLAALTLTDQGKKITQAAMGGSFLPALGESGSDDGNKASSASDMKQKSDKDEKKFNDDGEKSSWKDREKDED